MTLEKPLKELLWNVYSHKHPIGKNLPIKDACYLMLVHQGHEAEVFVDRLGKYHLFMSHYNNKNRCDNYMEELQEFLSDTLDGLCEKIVMMGLAGAFAVPANDDDSNLDKIWPTNL